MYNLGTTSVTTIPPGKNAKSDLSKRGVYLPEHRVVIVIDQGAEHEKNRDTRLDGLKHPGLRSDATVSHERMALHQCFDAKGNSQLTPRQWKIMAFQLLHILNGLGKNNLATSNCLDDLKISHAGHLYLGSTSIVDADAASFGGNLMMGSIYQRQFHQPYEARIAFSQNQSQKLNATARGADLWAAGIWLLQLAVGKKAFQSTNYYKMMDEPRCIHSEFDGFKSLHQTFLSQKDEYIKELRDLLPKNEFGQQAWTILQHLLVMDPKQRVQGFRFEALCGLDIFNDLDREHPFSGNHLFLPYELIEETDAVSTLNCNIVRLSIYPNEANITVQSFIHEGAASVEAMQWQKDETLAASNYFLTRNALILSAVDQQSHKKATDAIIEEHFSKHISSKDNPWYAVLPDTMQRLRQRDNIFTVKEWDQLRLHFDVDNNAHIRISIEDYHDPKKYEKKEESLKTLKRKLSPHQGRHTIFGELYRRVEIELRQLPQRAKCQEIMGLPADPLSLMDAVNITGSAVTNVPVESNFEAMTMRHSVAFLLL